MYVTISSPPSIFLGLASVGSQERPFGHWAPGEMAGSADLNVSLSCVMPGRSLGYFRVQGLTLKDLTLNSILFLYPRCVLYSYALKL